MSFREIFKQSVKQATRETYASTKNDFVSLNRLFQALVAGAAIGLYFYL